MPEYAAYNQDNNTEKSGFRVIWYLATTNAPTRLSRHPAEAYNWGVVSPQAFKSNSNPLQETQHAQQQQG